MIYTDLIFMFAFFPVVVILTYCCSEDWSKNTFSLLGSLLFITWGRSAGFALIILPVLVIYILGNLIPKSGGILEALGDIVALGSASAAIIFLPDRGTLSHALLCTGFVLYALRAINYLKKVSEGMKPERKFLCVAVYLISFENMLIAPLASYDKVRDRLSSRRPELSKASEGIVKVIEGFAFSAIFALSFDAVRLSATEYSAFPWMNALILPAAVFFEIYAVVLGFGTTSRGMSLMLGFAPEKTSSALRPKANFSEHISEIWKTLPEFVCDCFAERSLAGFFISIAATAVLSGIFIGLGIGIAGFLGIVILGIILSSRREKTNPVAEAVFSAIFTVASVMILSYGSLDGIAGFIKALDYSAYEYDITYALNYELTRRLPWLILGILAVSPLSGKLSRFIQRKASESEKAYAAYKTAETVFCALLLIVSAAAVL